MELEKQRLLISALATNRELLALTSGILKPVYFDPSLKKSVKFMLGYFEKYKDVPKLATIRAETGLILEDIGKIERADISYVASEVETFCRNEAFTEAIMKGPEFLEKQDFGAAIEMMKQAISVGLQKDIGLDYFKDPESRLKRTLEDEAAESTGYPELDVALGGGVARQELLLLTATSGGGKSMAMLNIARNLLSRGLNGVYISLEMSEGRVSRRLDSMISHISQDNLHAQMQKVINSIEKAAFDGYGRFIVKRMPENRTNANHIRSYLHQLEQEDGFRPDFIVVDYVDIMGSTQVLQTDNMFLKDKYCVEELRALMFDFNAVGISASQLGRNAETVEKLTQSNIQGGMSKVNTADYLVAIKQDDLMRAQGEIVFEILKVRNSGDKGKKILLEWDPISLLIKNLASAKNKLNLVKKSSKPILGTEGLSITKTGDGGVLNLMNT